MWNQVYNPMGSAVLSTVFAAIPVVTLLVLIARKVHIALVAVPGWGLRRSRRRTRCYFGSRPMRSVRGTPSLPAE